VLKVPADATVVIIGVKTTQKGAVRTYYTPTLAPGYKYQYEVSVTWTEAGKDKSRTEWVDVTAGKTTNIDWAGAGKEVKKDDVKKDDVKKDTAKKYDVKKDDVKKDTGKKDDVKKDDVKKDDVKKDDVKKDTFKKDDFKKDTVKKDDVKKDDVKKDDVKKDAGKKDDVKKDDVKKDTAKKDDVKKDDVKKETKPADEKGFVKLFTGSDLSGFKENVFGKKEGIKSPFEVKDGVINVSGNPNGYFYTEKSYKNFILRFDWKYLKDGNSGLLVHIQGHGGGWPKSVEVQGMQKDHGNIFAIGGAKGSFKKDAAAQKDAIKIGEWNTTEVISENGKLTAKVNGVQVSTGETDLRDGPLGWQSEGAPLQFKNIRIKVLD